MVKNGSNVGGSGSDATGAASTTTTTTTSSFSSIVTATVTVPSSSSTAAAAVTATPIPVASSPVTAELSNSNSYSPSLPSSFPGEAVAASSGVVVINNDGQPLPDSFFKPTDNVNNRINSQSQSQSELPNNNSKEESNPLIPPVTVVKPNVCIGTARLFAIMFVACIGGAYGIEDAVGTVGPLLAIIAIVTLPWLLQFPMCMLTAELSSSLPSNSGLIQWTNCAFGKYARFFTSQSIFLSIVVSVTDNAVYPALLVSYLIEIVPIDTVWQGAIKAAVVVFSVALNIIGVDIVGAAALLMTLVVVSPFIVLVAFGLPQIEPSSWLTVPAFKEMNFAVFFPLIFWNLNGVDGAGNLSEEIENPKKSFPRAMVLLTLATSACYLLPVLVGISVDTDWQNWSDGYFVTVASQIGPQWIRVSLPWMMLVGGMISSIGFLVTLLCTSSRLIHGVAELNIVPVLCKPFTRLHRRFKTPDTCILLNGAVILLMALFLNFEELVAVDCVFYALRLVIEIASLLMLRYRYPLLPRPIKIGLGMRGLIAFCTFPLVFCGVTMVVGCTVSLKSGLLAAGLLVVSLLLGVVFQFLYKKELPKLPEIIEHEKLLSMPPQVTIASASMNSLTVITDMTSALATAEELSIKLNLDLNNDDSVPAAAASPSSPSPSASPAAIGSPYVGLREERMVSMHNIVV